MANLTLTIDDDLLRRARIRALEQGTSVNALVRDYLAGYGGDDAARSGLEAFLAATETSASGSGAGGRSWSRDELHER